MSELEGWVTTNMGAALTGYSTAYIRMLAGGGRIKARRIGRDWLVHQESLLDHKRQMLSLGPQKYNPWREDLGADRGRKRREVTGGGADLPQFRDTQTMVISFTGGET